MMRLFRRRALTKRRLLCIAGCLVFCLMLNFCLFGALFGTAVKEVDHERQGNKPEEKTSEHHLMDGKDSWVDDEEDENAVDDEEDDRTVDEAVYFSSLPLPDDPDLPPLGIRRVEELPTSGPSRIQRRLHQTWNTDQVPTEVANWIRSWTRLHPDWEYWLWTHRSARQLIQDRYPALLPVYDAYTRDPERDDAVRYVVLHEFGGVHADLDTESLRPLDALAARYACFLGQEPDAHAVMFTNVRHLASNALMACRRGHPFMKMAVDSLPDFAHMWSHLDRTGPHFISSVLRRYQRQHPQVPADHADGVYLTPPEYFSPTMDRDKLWLVRSICRSEYSRLRVLQKRVCQNLKTLPPEAERLAMAFATHYWIHTYPDMERLYRDKVQPIQTVVQGVKIYKGPRSVGGLNNEF